MPKPYQLNISPSEETLEILDQLVKTYGERHRSCKNRNSIAAEVLDQFLPIWGELLKRRDAQLLETQRKILSKGKAEGGPEGKAD